MREERDFMMVSDKGNIDVVECEFIQVGDLIRISFRIDQNFRLEADGDRKFRGVDEDFNYMEIFKVTNKDYFIGELVEEGSVYTVKIF